MRAKQQKRAKKGPTDARLNEVLFDLGEVLDATGDLNYLDKAVVVSMLMMVIVGPLEFEEDADVTMTAAQKAAHYFNTLDAGQATYSNSDLGPGLDPGPSLRTDREEKRNEIQSR